MRNSLANGLNYAVIVVSAILLTPLIIKGFGSAVYGVWILLNQVAGYVGLLDVGVQPAVAKRVAEARSIDEHAGLRDFLMSAFSLQTAAAGLTMLLVLGLAVGFPSWIHPTGVPTFDVRSAVIIVGATTALAFPSGVFSAALKGALRFDLVSWVGIASQLSRVIGLFVALHMKGGINGLALTGLLAALITFFGGAVCVRFALGVQSLRRGRASWPHVVGIARFGGLTLLTNTGWYLSYATDAAVIGWTLSVTDVAHFGLAANVVIVLSGLVGAFSGTLMPIAAQLETGGRRTDTQNTYLTGTRVCLTLMIPATLGLLLAGPELLSVWVGRDFGAPAGQILRVLVLAHFAIIVNGPGFHMAIGIGLNGRVAMLSIVEGMLNLALSYVLAKRIGVIGVAVGTLIPSVLSHSLAMPALVRARLGISTRRFLQRAVVPAAWPLVPALLAAGIWRWLVPMSSDRGTIAWASAISFIYVVITAAVFLIARRRRSLRP